MTTTFTSAFVVIAVHAAVQMHSSLKQISQNNFKVAACCCSPTTSEQQHVAIVVLSCGLHLHCDNSAAKFSF